jgi:glycosyltransferase involved in cell wall biosynthesis
MSSAADPQPARRISVIAPMLNEAAHVEHFVADLAAQDYEGELEIFVADGGSADGSVERLTEAASRAGLDLTVLDNPRRWVSPGLNLCLEHVTGDLVVRLDCHSRYPADYLSACTRVSAETGAWNVGGLFEIEGRTPFERAVAVALDSPFGGHNWTRNRERRHEADTVFCGAFLPVAFERAGRYDEELAVVEVEDLNTRIRAAGGRVVYDPSIRLTYTPRGTFRGVFVQYYRYGLWKVRVTVKFKRVLSGRSFVPIVFVGSLATLGAAAPVSAWARRLLAAELAVYGSGAAVAAAEAIRRRDESWQLFPSVVALFPTMHAAHGLGGVHGWLRVARRALAGSQ